MNARIYTVTVLLLLLAACTSKPLVNVVDEPLGSEQSMAAVHEAIFAAGHAHGWVMKDAGSASIVATLDVRGHHVVVNIDYSTTEFSITYVDSDDMDAKNGNIHRNYNRWVNNIRVGIHTELGLVAPS